MDAATTEKPRPRIGIGIVLENAEGEVLLLLRKGSHGDGEWALPGGSLEFGETIFSGAKREAQEELGIQIDYLSIVSLNDELQFIPTHQKHFVVIVILAKTWKGEPRIMEPEKCAEMRWFSRDALPAPLFASTSIALQNISRGILYENLS